MLSFTATAVLIVIAVIIYFVFIKEFRVKKKIVDFPVKFPEDKNKVSPNCSHKALLHAQYIHVLIKQNLW